MKVLSCEYCEFKAYGVSRLKQHDQEHNREKQKFVCKLCTGKPYSGGSGPALSRHMKANHKTKFDEKAAEILSKYVYNTSPNAMADADQKRASKKSPPTKALLTRHLLTLSIKGRFHTSLNRHSS